MAPFDETIVHRDGQVVINITEVFMQTSSIHIFIYEYMIYRLLYILIYDI